MVAKDMHTLKCYFNLTRTAMFSFRVIGILLFSRTTQKLFLLYGNICFYNWQGVMSHCSWSPAASGPPDHLRQSLLLQMIHLAASGLQYFSILYNFWSNAH